VRGTGLRIAALGASIAVIIAVLALELASASLGQTIPRPPHYSSTASHSYALTPSRSHGGTAASTSTRAGAAVGGRGSTSRRVGASKSATTSAQPGARARAPGKPSPPRPSGPNPDRDRALREMRLAYSSLREAAKLVSGVRGESGRYLAKLLDTALGLYRQSIDLFKRSLFSLSAAYAHAARDIASEVVQLCRGHPSPPQPPPPPPPP